MPKAGIFNDKQELIGYTTEDGVNHYFQGVTTTGKSATKPKVTTTNPNTKGVTKAMAKETKTEGKILQADKLVKVVELAIKEQAPAKDGKKYDSIHVKYGGLNSKLRAYGYDPIESINKAIEQGKLFSRGAKGGIMVSPRPFASSARDVTVSKEMDKLLS